MQPDLGAWEHFIHATCRKFKYHNQLLLTTNTIDLVYVLQCKIHRKCKGKIKSKVEIISETASKGCMATPLVMYTNRMISG
jgi:hypothetical protein